MMIALPTTFLEWVSFLWATATAPRAPTRAESIELIQRSVVVIRELRQRAEVAERGCVCLRRELEAARAELAARGGGR